MTDHPPFMPGWRDRVGHCYRLAGDYTLSHRDAVLVHGTIQGPGLPAIGHAWVELDNGETIHDPVTGWTCNTDWWIEFHSAIPEARYTFDEAAAATIAHEHWGPWHDEDPAQQGATS